MFKSPRFIHHPMLQRSVLFFTLLSLVTLLAACGGSTTTSNSSTTPTSGTTAATCDKSTGLTVYSAHGYDSDATKAFQQQTAITTKLVADSTGHLLSNIPG